MLGKIKLLFKVDWHVILKVLGGKFLLAEELVKCFTARGTTSVS